jgi:transglutaminase-like putative cysteine protease/glutamine cyclotransferase
MLKTVRNAAIASTATLWLCAGAVLAAPGDVRKTIDLPCKYPAGLASDGASLYVLDWREAKIYKLAAADGTVEQTWPAPTLKPRGLTCGGGRLFVSDDQSGSIYALNPQTGIIEDTFAAPDKQASGLAYVDGNLWILEKRSKTIYKVAPDDGTILATCPAPDAQCGPLSYDGKYLWTANRVRNEIYMLEPDTGAVLNILDAPGPYVAGLAWLDGQLWADDFQTRKLYRIATDDNPPYRLSEPREDRCEFYWALYNYGPGEIRDLTVNVALPHDLPNQKILSPLQYSRSPAQTRPDQWDQQCALFDCGAVPPGEKATLGYAAQVRLSAMRFFINPEKTGTLAHIPADIKKTYTVDDPHLQVASPYIQKLAGKIVGHEQNPYWAARKIYDYVIEHVEYEMVGGWDIPETVLKRGKGSCSEYTFAFIALCRAAGLPARYQGSVVVRGDDASVDDAFHRWAQVYLPNYGWVPVDPSKGDSKSPVDRARGFGDLANRFLITTEGGGNSEYLKWGYNSYSHYKMTGYCKVEEDNLGIWEPLAPTPQQAQAAGRQATAGPSAHAEQSRAVPARSAAPPTTCTPTP